MRKPVSVLSGRCNGIAALVWLAAALTAAPGRAQRPAAPELLPETTSLFVTVVDVPTAASRFMSTSLGRMSQDPQVRPLIQQVYGSLVEAAGAVQKGLGMSLPELLSIPQGEVAFAVVTPEDRPAAMVLILDAGKRVTSVQTLLQRADEALTRSGAKRIEEAIDGTKVITYGNLGSQRRSACYFIKDTTLVVATDPEVIKQVLSAWGGHGGATLDGNAGFSDVMRRCTSSAGEPQLAWYVNPIEMMRSIGRENTGAQVAVAVLPVLGLDGLAAAGGAIMLDSGDFDQLTQFHVLLDGPRTGVLKAVAPYSGDFTPEPWVPDDVASYNTVFWKLEQSLDAVAEVFDGFRGEGAFAQFLEERFKEQVGIDVRGELLPALTGRVTLVRRIERPVTPNSQSTMVALELEKDAKLEPVLEKIFEKNRKGLARRSAAGIEYYEGTGPESSTPPDPNRPPRPPRPRPCFGLIGGYLVIADRANSYQKALETAGNPSGGLAASLDFKLLASKMRRQPGGNQPAAFRFARAEEGIRFLYEVALQEQTQEALSRQRNPVARSLNSALQQGLPPFDVLKRYLAPGGAIVLEDSSGLHYTGFSLKRK